MRILRYDTRATLIIAAGLLGAGAACALPEWARPVVSPAVFELCQIDAALTANRPSEALRRIAEASIRQDHPQLQWRAAQAYAALGQLTGTLSVQTRGGHTGQFAGDVLLIEPRGSDRFLCCPRASALFQVRQALDGGLRLPEAHLLHARCWLALERPQVALQVVRGAEAALLDDATPETLATLAQIALAADSLPDYLRYERLHARRDPEHRTALLSTAYLTAADRYSAQGDAAMCLHWLRRATRLRPDDAALLLRIADIEWADGNRAAAGDLYERLLLVAPENPQCSRARERLAEVIHTPTTQKRR